MANLENSTIRNRLHIIKDANLDGNLDSRFEEILMGYQLYNITKLLSDNIIYGDNYANSVTLTGDHTEILARKIKRNDGNMLISAQTGLTVEAQEASISRTAKKHITDTATDEYYALSAGTYISETAGSTVDIIANSTNTGIITAGTGNYAMKLQSKGSMYINASNDNADVVVAAKRHILAKAGTNIDLEAAAGSYTLRAQTNISETATTGSITRTATAGSITDTAKNNYSLTATSGSITESAGTTISITGGTGISETATTGNITRTATAGAISDTAGTSVTIKANNGTLQLNSTAKDVNIQAKTNLTEKADGNYSLTVAGTTTVSSTGNISITAGNNSTALLKSNANLTITSEAGDVIINATASGKSIKLNNNVSIAGTLGVTGNTTLSGTLSVTGNTTIGDTLSVTGATTLSSTLGVTGNVTVGNTSTHSSITSHGSLYIKNGSTNKFTVAYDTGNTSIAGTLSVTGVTTLSSTLGVTGATTLSDTLTVSKATTLNSTLSVTGNTTVGGMLGVTGATTLSSTLGVVGNVTVGNTSTHSSITSHGSLYIKNNTTTKFSVAYDTGNTDIAGTLGVTGNTTLGGTLGVTGDTTVKQLNIDTGDGNNYGSKPIVDAMFPVGTIYLSVDSRNPGDYLPKTKKNGSWTKTEWDMIAKGQTLIGVNPNDTNFNTAEKTGGTFTHSHNVSNASGKNFSATGKFTPEGSLSGSISSGGSISWPSYTITGQSTGGNYSLPSHSHTLHKTFYDGGTQYFDSYPLIGLQTPGAFYDSFVVKGKHVDENYTLQENEEFVPATDFSYGFDRVTVNATDNAGSDGDTSGWHDHSLNGISTTRSGGTFTPGTVNLSGGTFSGTEKNLNINISGSTENTTTIPSYYTCYMWKRKA